MIPNTVQSLLQVGLFTKPSTHKIRDRSQLRDMHGCVLSSEASYLASLQILCLLVLISGDASYRIFGSTQWHLKKVHPHWRWWMRRLAMGKYPRARDLISHDTIRWLLQQFAYRANILFLHLSNPPKAKLKVTATGTSPSICTNIA